MKLPSAQTIKWLAKSLGWTLVVTPSVFAGCVLLAFLCTKLISVIESYGFSGAVVALFAMLFTVVLSGCLMLFKPLE